MNQDREREFPRLDRSEYRDTSVETNEYNCIAWAGNDDTEKWDPDATTGRYWPDERIVPRGLDVENFVKLYHYEGGYVPCDNSDLEEGFEKIALFVGLDKEVTHAARQLPSGKWTSKLGDWEDIEHDALDALVGDWYGTVARILKRPIQ